MSTVSEIELAIAKLQPEEFAAVHDWVAKRAEGRAGRKWTPEELTAGAKRMADEPDPERAKLLKEELMRGFYGIADA